MSLGSMPDEEGHVTPKELEAHRAALERVIDEARTLREEVTALLEAIRQDAHNAKRERPSGLERRRTPRKPR